MWPLPLMYWDCATEAKARDGVAGCGNPAPTAPTDYGMLEAKIPTKKTCDATALVDTTLKKLFKDGAKKQASNAFDAANKDFNQVSLLRMATNLHMAYEATTAIGCSYKRCGSELNLLCFYNKDPATIAPPLTKIYEETNTLCDGCNGGPAGANDCVEALCKGSQPAALNEPTMCTAQASKLLMTDDLRKMAWNLHDYYRRLLATGWAEDGKIKYAKPAAAMPKLEYSCEMEEKIAPATNACDGKTAALTEPNNVAILNTLALTREEALKQAIEDWWSALKKTGVEDNKYSDSMEGQPLQKYVNMAYDKTTALGCGVDICQKIGKTIVQCGYVVDTWVSFITNQN
ncbi:SCP-like protein [Ancylostoma ceylanicum]|uniref:SCP-like protein n=1 Tax=Ancylostoma ceylanicum TaxID=53326 RepID=A0A0D6LEG9_9BILA|nr:SCP-like protein [Ancylostoma ceylanicum]